MKRLAMRRDLTAGVVAAALGSLFLPAAADAKFPPSPEDAEAPPGITITGIGFARVAAPRRVDRHSMERAVDAAHPAAVNRAVRDARRRAESTGRALGIQAGEVNQIELEEINQFGDSSRCRRQSAGRTPRCRLTAAAATVTFEILGGATGAEGSRLVRAHGAATAPVDPSNSERNQPIRRAVLAARRSVTPQAAQAGRRNAVKTARSADLTLSAIVSISESSPYYYPYFYDAALGSFGPGQFCGLVRRAIIHDDPETGRPRVVGWVRQRRCRVDRSYSLHLEITYEAR